MKRKKWCTWKQNLTTKKKETQGSKRPVPKKNKTNRDLNWKHFKLNLWTQISRYHLLKTLVSKNEILMPPIYHWTIFSFFYKWYYWSNCDPKKLILWSMKSFKTSNQFFYSYLQGRNNNFLWDNSCHGYCKTAGNARLLEKRNYTFMPWFGSII